MAIKPGTNDLRLFRRHVTGCSFFPGETFQPVSKKLETKLTAIDRALLALRDIDGTESPETTAGPIEKPASTRQRRKMSAATRRKMRLSAIARYARLKGEVPF
jgi:hypothetical protein